jgi:hypothetical protein
VRRIIVYLMTVSVMMSACSKTQPLRNYPIKNYPKLSFQNLLFVTPAFIGMGLSLKVLGYVFSMHSPRTT